MSGLAGGKGKAVIFRKGTVVRTVAEDSAVDELMAEIDTILNGKENGCK